MAALLPDRTLAVLRTIKVRALQVIGVGGASWTATPAAGGATRAVVGYAHEESADAMQDAPAGIRAPANPWRFVLISGALESGDAIVSAADSSIRFTVQQPLPGTLYPTAIIEPIGTIPVSTQ